MFQLQIEKIHIEIKYEFGADLYCEGSAIQWFSPMGHQQYSVGNIDNYRFNILLQAVSTKTIILSSCR